MSTGTSREALRLAQTPRATMRSGMSLTIKGDENMHIAPGASTHEEDRTAGWVIVYTGHGSLHVSADSPEALRRLADAFLEAAGELDGLRAEAVSA